MRWVWEARQDLMSKWLAELPWSTRVPIPDTERALIEWSRGWRQRHGGKLMRFLESCCKERNATISFLCPKEKKSLLTVTWEDLQGPRIRQDKVAVGIKIEKRILLTEGKKRMRWDRNRVRRREGIYRSECHNETVAELRRYLPSSSDQPLLSLHDSAMKSNHQTE